MHCFSLSAARRRFLNGALVAVLAVLSACGGNGDAETAAGPTPPPSPTPPVTPLPPETPTPPEPPVTPPPSPSASCTPATFMGSSSLLVGASMNDDTASSAPFDARYLYLAGGVRQAGQCSASCDGSCGSWWGCWQDPAQPPGRYVTDFFARSASATWQGRTRAQIPMITYYQILAAADFAEGGAEVDAINDAGRLARYLDDWRFLLQRIGNAQAMLHVEPDFWAYGRNMNGDPTRIPAQVKAANAADCAAQDDNLAGMARCMIAMARKYAPNAKVGLHASPWLIGQPGDGVATGRFMAALGAGEGDFVVADLSDRDAGYYQSIGQDRWYSDEDRAAYLDWTRDVVDTVGKPMVLWQIPVGNMAQNNTPDHWQDTLVDDLFGDLPAVAEAGVAALLFGAGGGGQTTPETDGGNLVAKTRSYRAGGGVAVCR